MHKVRGVGALMVFVGLALVGVNLALVSLAGIMLGRIFAIPVPALVLGGLVLMARPGPPWPEGAKFDLEDVFDELEPGTKIPFFIATGLGLLLGVGGYLYLEFGEVFETVKEAF